MIVATLVVSALYFGKEVLVPIILAAMLSFVLSSLVNLLQRLRLWRAPAVILSVLVALGSLGARGYTDRQPGCFAVAGRPDLCEDDRGQG